MRTSYQSDPIHAASRHLAKSISLRLQGGEKVLWLLSGGSGLQACIQTAILLGSTDCSNLKITLTDERYGPVGHQDENWQQLLDSYNFDLPGVTLYRPLIDQPRPETAQAFADWLKQAFYESSYRVGLFGIGADGHTAGIKPGSPATYSSDWVVGYSGDDFERLTITPEVIGKLDEAIIQATGENKTTALDNLVYKSLSTNWQPAQALKQVPESTLYTNIQKFN